MRQLRILCENRPVLRHSAITRAIAAFLSTLLALPPLAWAAMPSTTVVVLPYAGSPGLADGMPARVAELVAQELKGRAELKLVPLKTEPSGKSQPDPIAQAKSELGKAAQLAQRSRHAQSADALQRAIGLLASKPAALDETNGRLLTDAALQLAVERLASGDEDGGDAALAQLVRLAPERELNPADYPPAFLVELSGVRKRMLAAPRGSLRVLAPPGSGESRLFVDGRKFPAAPVVVRDLIPGEHFVRVDRDGAAWGERLVVIAGVETTVAPQPGADGPAAELTGALLTGELDRAAATTAGRLARASGAQAAVFGAAIKSGTATSVRSFLCLARGDRVFELTPLQLDAELLGGVVQMVKLGDDVVLKLASPPAESPLPISLRATTAPAAEARAAPAPEPELALAPLVAPAPALAPPAPAQEPARRVAVPGAPVPVAAPTPPSAPSPAPPPAPARLADAPSRALVIPRQPMPDDEPPPQTVKLAKANPQPQPTKRLEALEPGQIKTVKEPPPPEKKNHTALWIIAGVLLAGGLAAGGYYLYVNNQTPTTASVNTTWTH